MRLPITSKFKLLGIFTILAVACSSAQGGLFTTIDISSIANGNLQATNSAFPSGAVTLGGVPFAIASSGDNFYFSDPDGLGGTAIAVIPINLSGVTGIHTLINTAWGEQDLGTFASLTFNFSDSTSFVKTLDGNVDIRDFYDNVFTNSINGTTTQNVFSTDNDAPGRLNVHRLDKQFIDLSAYSAKTLVSMTLTDSGATGFQRTFLSGVTAESSISAVPEPSSFLMASIALVGVLLVRRRSAKA